MPNLPFWREQAHRHAVLSSYRSLQRLATQFDSSLHKRYLYYEIRERFRYHQHSTSLQQTKQLLAEANLVYDKLKQASLGEVETMRWLDNHAQAKTGRLYQVLTKIQLHQRSTPSRYINDIRSKKARKQDPHKRYRFPWPLELYEKAGILPANKEKTCANTKKSGRSSRKPLQTRCHVTSTSLGYIFRRYKPMVQPHWLSMMLKRRAQQAVFRVENGRRMEEWRSWLSTEEQMMRSLGIKDYGWDKAITEELNRSRKHRQQLEEALMRQQSSD